MMHALTVEHQLILILQGFRQKAESFRELVWQCLKISHILIRESFMRTHSCNIRYHQEWILDILMLSLKAALRMLDHLVLSQ